MANMAWSVPPGPDLRRLKTMMETEMMVKLGAQKETIEFHPLILAQRAHRPKSHFTPEYSRVKPPYQEQISAIRNPWELTDKAARQLSRVSKQGPRQVSLPRVPPYKTIRTVHIPPEDEEYRKRRVWRLWKRDELLAEWTAFQRQAFTVRHKSLLTLSDLEPLRRYSTSSLFSSRSTTAQPLARGDRPNKAKHSSVPVTHPPPVGKAKSRWYGMARQLLWYTKTAQMRVPEELPRSEVRIYVSCTADLSEEREFLAEVAYPELRKFCEKHGLTCHVVDLRHGNNRLSNTRDTCDLVKSEIVKCQRMSIGPCFVSLLGREADDEDLPGWLEAQDMLAVRGVLVRAADEPAVEALDNLYRLDSNYQPPIYLLQERADGGATLQKAVLRTILPDVLQQLRERGEVEDAPVYYPYSSTVKELQWGLLSCPEPRRQTVCLMARSTEGQRYRRTFSPAAATTQSDVQAQDLLPSDYTASVGNASGDRLRSAVVDVYNRLGSSNNLILFNLSSKKSLAYLREICTLFLSAVTRLIERQMTHTEFEISQHLTPAADAIQHVVLGRRACLGHVGGEEVWGPVAEALRDPTRLTPLVVSGPEGAGKTAMTSLLALAITRMDPLRKVVFRAAGLTLQSFTLFHLLKSLYHHLTFLYDAPSLLTPDLTLTGVLDSFVQLLHSARDRMIARGQMTLVLDGMDKLPDVTAAHLLTLMSGLPHGVSLVMSLTSAGPLYEAVKTFGPGIHEISCPRFTPERTQAYLESYLGVRQRVLTEDQVRAVMRELNEEATPLLVRTACAQTVRWPSHTLHEVLDISSDPESAFHRVLEACEIHIGHSFTRCAVSLLVASRFGLAEFELLHVLATDSQLLDQLKEEAEEELSVTEGYPYQLHLTCLLHRLHPFLLEVKVEGETLVKVGHDGLRRVMVERYLLQGWAHHVHARLAAYFQFTRRGNLLSSRDIVEGRYKVNVDASVIVLHLGNAEFEELEGDPNMSHNLWRTLRSVPYHLCHAFSDPQDAWKKLKSEVFMKFSWIINEIYAGFFNDFLDDLSYCINTLGLDHEILFLRQFLSGVREAVIFNPVSLASLMASQDLEGLQQVQQSVTEAQEWLKQVHLQVLVPTSYSAPKASQLQLNPTLARNVKSVVSDSSGDRVVLQYSHHLTSLNPTTGEESSPLTTTRRPIVSVHLWGQASMLTIVTSGAEGPDQGDVTKDGLALETFSLEKGRHVMSCSVEDGSVKWLLVRSDGVALYATEFAVKRLALDKGTTAELCRTPEEIVDATSADSRHSKLVTLHVQPRTQLRVFDPRQPGLQRVIALKEAALSEVCKPLAMTKDSLHVIVACQRQLRVVDLVVERVVHVLGLNNVPLSLLSLSRSHEHVFAVTPTDVVRCFKLATGAVVMEANVINPQPSGAVSAGQQSVSSASPPRGKRTASPSHPGSRTPTFTPAPTQRKDGVQEHVTALVTSEDDHFLFASTTRGRVVMLHVPTGAEACVIRVGADVAVGAMTYFSSAAWFQSLVTVEEGGQARLWNLRPVLSKARQLIMDIITDKDLLAEEGSKQDLGHYFSHFQQRHNDRIFLNGPDVAAFYRKPLPPGLFDPMTALDPALLPSQSWVTTGRLGDVSDVCAISTGCDLSEILVTVDRQGNLARWSLQDGSLTALRPCPWLLRQGDVVESTRPVYYDQALCVVVRQPDGRKTVAVQYPEDKTPGLLIINDVITTRIANNGSVIVHAVSDKRAELTLVYWDILNGREHQRVVISKEAPLTRLAAALTFSMDLSRCALIVGPQVGGRKQKVEEVSGGEEREGSEPGEYVVQVWTVKLDKDGQGKETEAGLDETQSFRGAKERPMPESERVTKGDGNNKTTDFNIKPTSVGTNRVRPDRKATVGDEICVSCHLNLHVKATVVGFDPANKCLLAGTELGLVLVASLETLTVTSVLTSEGVEPVTLAKHPAGLSQFSPPHIGGVRSLDSAGSGDSHVIISTCDRVLCAWNLAQKRLLVTVKLQADTDKFLHHWLSRDCRVLVFVTSQRALSVWDVNGRRQLCAFRVQSTVTSLAVTPDCRRVALHMDDGVTSAVRVYDVRNIDDIRVEDAGREKRQKPEIGQQNRDSGVLQDDASDSSSGGAASNT